MLMQAGIFGLSLWAGAAMAAVSAQEADQLGTRLTPLGAEKSGNADGSIPAWSPMPRTAGTVLPSRSECAGRGRECDQGQRDPCSADR
ncbi:hypothetical protein AO269_14950 [Pseudomonas putida]|nr:hypothetical protein AO269_14950 [Pseudomonas putida]